MFAETKYKADYRLHLSQLPLICPLFVLDAYFNYALQDNFIDTTALLWNHM